MTLIIGAECQDGIVLGSDRKLRRGEEVDYEDKIFEMGNSIIGFVGLTGIRDDFLLVMNSEITRIRPRSLYELKVIIEDVVNVLSDRYRGRLSPGEEQIEAILGGLEHLNSGDAKLYHVVGGYAERIRFLCIGHGSPYATSISKFLYRRDSSVEEMAKMIAFTIAWVAEDIDASVGGKPQVLTVKNQNPSVKMLEDDVVEKLEKKSKEAKNKRRDVLGL
jgi:20S proteasome alpha/beta subunit